MSGTQGWTEEALRKMCAGGRKGAKQMGVRSCGKRHSWCRICNPSVLTGCLSSENLRLRSQKHVQQGTFAGTKNPNWKGGKHLSLGPGWKTARRKVWARDKVCRACGGVPSPKRQLDVHHIVSQRDGGSHEDLDNLIGLHHGCHMKVHAGKLTFR